MNVKELDKQLAEIIKKKEELGKVDYNDSRYDELEDSLHDLEDDFIEKYGDYLEDKLQDVHDKFCPDTDVLSPAAYIGKGVLVDLDKLPGKEARLIFEANPTRLVLAVKEKQEVVWKAE